MLPQERCAANYLSVAHSFSDSTKAPRRASMCTKSKRASSRRATIESWTRSCASRGGRIGAICRLMTSTTAATATALRHWIPRSDIGHAAGTECLDLSKVLETQHRLAIDPLMSNQVQPRRPGGQVQHLPNIDRAIEPPGDRKS